MDGFSFIPISWSSSAYVCSLFRFEQKGTKAPAAAGKIHTDFEKGFIMADVMKFDDFKAEGSEAAVKVRVKASLRDLTPRSCFYSYICFFLPRLQANTSRKGETMLLRMVTSSTSSLMQELVYLIRRRNDVRPSSS